MTLEQAVGAELRLRRQNAGLSQEDLAFEAGVHRTYVSLIERGLKSPTLHVTFRLCAAMRIAPEEFVQGVSRRKPKTA